VNQIKLFVFSPAFGGRPEDKKFSAESIGQVKLKLDTPDLFQFDFFRDPNEKS